jgi:hypothetical protein
MAIGKQIVDFYIESSIHVALAACALILLTFSGLNTSYDASVAAFGFFGTIAAYNTIKYAPLISSKKWFLYPRNGLIGILSLNGYVGAIYCFMQWQTASQIVAIIALLFTLFYSFSFFGRLNSGRNWVGFKIFLVALSWMLVTFMLPVLAKEVTISVKILLLTFQRFVLVYALMCVFEIIDIQFDTLNLKTLPQRIGVQKTKQLGYFLLSLFLGIDIMIQSQWILLNFLFIVIIAIFLFFSHEKKSKYYTIFWVESIPIFWWLAQKLLTYS